MEQNCEFCLRAVLSGFIQIDIVGLVVHFFPSLGSSPIALTWLAVENSFFPVTALTNSTLACCEILVFLCAGVTIFWRPRPDLLTSIVHKVPNMGEGCLSKEKSRVEGFRENFLHSREVSYLILYHLLQEYLLWLDCMGDGCIAFLWVFNHGFADCTDFFLPNLRWSNQLFLFEIIIPNKKSRITGACADLKPMMCSERNSSLEIIQMYNQYGFCWLGIIPALQARLCWLIKNNTLCFQM